MAPRRSRQTSPGSLRRVAPPDGAARRDPSIPQSRYGNIACVPDGVSPDLAAVIRAAWALDTCDPVDADDWSAANPARGQCGSTALVIHDLLGGDLLIAEVIRGDGSRQGVHYWNLLPDGNEVDLTRGQFSGDEVVQQPRIVRRPAGPPKRCAEQYLRMRHRVLDALGIPEKNDTISR
jgi:hypothetical protein